MDNAADQSPQLRVSPLVIPRGCDKEKLYFYVVFTLPRVGDGGRSLQQKDQTPLPASAIPPFLRNAQKPWPAYVCELLKNQKFQFALRELDSQGAAGADNVYFASSIQIETPQTPQGKPAEWGVKIVGGKQHSISWAQWQNEAGALWNDLVITAVPSDQARGAAIKPMALQTKSQPQQQNLAKIYWDHRSSPLTGNGPVVANPTQASDLRPGRRLESLDSRAIHRALQTAKEGPNPTAPPPAAASAPPINGNNPPGLETILTIPEKQLDEFIAYLKNVRNGKVLAGLIVNVWRTWTRAEVNHDFIHDPKFKLAFQDNMAADPEMKATWDTVLKSYREFLLHRGQTEVRRHGRFMDGARHRYVSDNGAAATTDSRGLPQIREVGFRKPPDKRDDPSPRPTFEEVISQIRQHPGLARRMGLTIKCSVKLADLKTADGTTLSNAANGQPSLSLAAQFGLTDTAASDHRWFLEPLYPTYCDWYPGDTFRARPGVEATFDPGDTGTALWRRYHLLAPKLYLATQDDYSLAAARGDMGVHPTTNSPVTTIETDAGTFSSYRVNAVNFYLTPQDDQGKPITVAQWLDEHMRQGAAQVDKTNLALCRALDRRQARHLLASFARQNGTAQNGDPAGGGAPDAIAADAPSVDLSHALYAEQLVQGYTIDVRRPGRQNPDWRSLCLRELKVETFPQGTAQSEIPAITWLFEEEGFLATSVLVAPRPYTGLVTAGPVLFRSDKVLDDGTVVNAGTVVDDSKVVGTIERYKTTFNVIDVRNTTSLVATGTCNVLLGKDDKKVPASVSEQMTRYSSLIHPICTITDIKASDMVLATPHGIAATGPDAADAIDGDYAPNAIHVDELVVHPVFYMKDQKRGNVLALDGSKLIIVTNAVPESATSQTAVTVREKELYPIMLTGHATRFLDELGNVLSDDPSADQGAQPAAASGAPADPTVDPNAFAFFTVEGEQRYYSAPWSGDDEFVEVATVPAGGKQVPPDKTLILSGLGPANTLAPAHLDPQTDAYDQLTAPTADGSTPPGIADADEPYGKTNPPQSLARLKDSSQWTLLRGEVCQAGFTVLTTLTQVNAKGSGVLKINGLLWKTVDGLLPLQIPGASNSSAYTLIWSDFITSPLPHQANSNIFVQLKGAIYAVDDKTFKAEIGECEVLTTTDGSDGLTAFSWNLSVRTIGGGTSIIVYPESPQTNKALANQPRFLHPATTQGWYVEAIGLKRADGIAGRAWPQRLLGSLVTAPNSKAGLLYFADGNTLNVAYPSGQAPQNGTRFFSVREDLKKGAAATPQCVDSPGVSVNSLLVAGEVSQVDPLPPVDSKEILITITDLDQNVWKIRWSSDIKLASAFSAMPPRQVRDLTPGEFLIAQCDVDSSRSAPLPNRLVVQSAGGSQIAKAVACLYGSIDGSQIGAMPHVQVVAEGTFVYQPVKLTTLLHQQLEIWCTTTSANHLRQENAATFVVGPSLRIIYAETVAKFATPTPPQKSDPAVQLPVHATISEAFARWGNWSLASPIPGHTDPEPGTTRPIDALFRLKSQRPDLTREKPDGAKRQRFALPTLRIGQPYGFFVRRVDLAGNHRYDDPLPRADDIASCINYLSSWEEQINQSSADRGGTTTTFDRADLPTKPVLAFKRGQTRPWYRPEPTKGRAANPPAARVTNLPAPRAASLPAATGNGSSTAMTVMPAVLRLGRRRQLAPQVCPYCGRRGCNGVACRRPQPVAPDYLGYKRPIELLLLTDAFRLRQSCDEAAEAMLLPPVCQVETVLLDGKLDQKDYRSAAECIRAHENRIGSDDADEHRLLSMLPNGDLNYFGDSAVKTVNLAVTSGDTYPCRPKQRPLPGTLPVQLASDAIWPRFCRVKLRLAWTTERVLTNNGLPLLAPQVPSGQHFTVPVYVQQTHPGDPCHCNSLVTLSLPQGTSGKLELKLPTAGTGNPDIPWSSVRLIHATNAAMRKPIWESLAESAVGNASGVANSSRNVNVAFHIDRPSSGSYKIVAYWNELWDEAVPLQHEPATADVVFQNGSATDFRNVRLGFGYGNTTVVLFDSPPGGNAELPVIEAVPNNGLVTIKELRIVKPGAHCPPALGIRVLRRPPLVRIAEGSPVIREGRIVHVNITDPGGWYQSPPFAVAHDPSGNGWGAQLVARLNPFGGVAAVEFGRDSQGRKCQGFQYSRETQNSQGTQIIFYTHRLELPEVPIPTTSASQPDGCWPLDADSTLVVGQFTQPFADAGSRSVDYVVQANSRFRDYLTGEASGGEPDEPSISVKQHVTRSSSQRTLPLSCQVRPSKPNVAYLMHAFRWDFAGKAKNLEEARRYFTRRAQGSLTVCRQAMVRVYMLRPWNRTGVEQLGVVVLPATLNTIAVDPPPPDPTASGPPAVTNISTDDRGGLNVVRADGIREPALKSESLGDYAMPSELRSLVSRCGYDPTRKESAFPPLTIDQFSARTIDPTYETLSTADQAAGNAAADFARLSWIAAHDVHYDASKERWYSDLRVELDGTTDDDLGVPFLQLALVTYQPLGLAGQRISSVYTCDMIKLLGDRTVELVRLNRCKFVVTLKGRFDAPPQGELFPQHKVTVSLRRRDAELPDEVVGYLPSISAREPRYSGWAADTEPLPIADAQKPIEFKSDDKGQTYSATLDFDPADLGIGVEQPAATYSLAVEEFDLYPAAGAALDRTGDSTLLIKGRLCEPQLVFSCTFDIEVSDAK